MDGGFDGGEVEVCADGSGVRGCGAGVVDVVVGEAVGGGWLGVTVRGDWVFLRWGWGEGGGRL